MEKIIKNLILRATSDILPIPDLALNLQIVDTVNNDPQSALYVVDIILQQLSAKDEIVVLTFELMEMLMKNSKHMHNHFGSKRVMDTILGLALGDSDYKIKELAMDFIQFYGNLFQYVPKLHFYPTLVTLKTKKVNLPSLRKDQWKPDGYKEPPKQENLSLDGPITTANLYYKINHLRTSKNLFDEVVENLTYGEDSFIKELYPQCLELHKQFVMFIQESGHKCQDKVLQELLTLNDDFAESLKKYQKFLHQPELLKQRDEERAKSKKGNINDPKSEKHPKKENPPPQKEALPKKETPEIGDLLQIEPQPGKIGDLFPSNFHVTSTSTNYFNFPSPPATITNTPVVGNVPQPIPMFGNGTQPNLGNVPQPIPIFGNGTQPNVGNLPQPIPIFGNGTQPNLNQPQPIPIFGNVTQPNVGNVPQPIPIFGNVTQPNLGNQPQPIPIFGNPPQTNPNPIIGNHVEPLIPSPLFPIPQPSTNTQLDLIFGRPTTPPNAGEDDDPFAALALRPRPTSTSVNH